MQHINNVVMNTIDEKAMEGKERSNNIKKEWQVAPLFMAKGLSTMLEYQIKEISN